MEHGGMVALLEGLRMYWLLTIAQVGNPESNDPAAQRADIWLLVLITVILIGGFVSVIWLTRKPKSKGRPPTPKPPRQMERW